MSLKNEAQSAFQNTKTFYKEYVSGMNRKRMGEEFYKDTDRLKQLYEEALSKDIEKQEADEIPGHLKFLRLFSSLTQRLNPTRRLIFGLSAVAFLMHYLFGVLKITGFVIFYELLLPFAYVSMLMLLLIELLEKSDVKRELDLAREIQLSLLPNTEYMRNHLEVFSFAHTARDVGGDYVDIIDTQKGTYIIIADVSGKGLSAALYMVRIQALVHLIINKNEPGPKELFLELNDYVKSDIKDKTFVTACAAFFPTDKDHFLFSRAGHNAPILFSNEKDTSFELRTDGYALGMTSSKNITAHLEEKKYRFKPNDSIIFFTDGLSEARNETGEEFGTERIDHIMKIYGSLHSKSIIHKIQSSLEHFIGKEKTVDDITISCVHYNKISKPS